MRFGLSEEVIKKLQQVFETEPEVQKALIFGSRAKGNYREGSDIDIAIKGQQISSHDVLTLIGKFEALNLPYEIDLVHYETIKEPALTAHIDRMGIEFYKKKNNHEIT